MFPADVSGEGASQVEFLVDNTAASGLSQLGLLWQFASDQ